MATRTSYVRDGIFFNDDKNDKLKCIAEIWQNIVFVGPEKN